MVMLLISSRRRGGRRGRRRGARYGEDRADFGIEHVTAKVFSNSGKAVLGAFKLFEELVVLVGRVFESAIDIFDFMVFKGADRAFRFVVAQTSLMERMHAKEMNSRKIE